MNGCNTSQKLEGVQQSAVKVSGTKKKQLEEHVATNWVIIGPRLFT